MKIRVGICSLILLSTPLLAQEEIGLRISNYSGVYGSQLNPSSFQSGKFKWDISLLGGGFFVHNDYQYVENTNLIHSLLNSGSLTFRDQNPDNVLYNPNALYYNFADVTRDMSNSFNAFISGPAISMRFSSFSIGLFTNFRIAMGANNIDKDLDNPSIEEWTFLETKFFDKMDAAGLVWGEIGLNIGGNISKTRHRSIDIGLNLKYLGGLDGFYVDLEERSKATGIFDTLQLVNGGPIEYGFSTGISGDNSGYNPQINGSGFGIDLGLNYFLNSSNNRSYLWKIGASLLDLGYIKFNQNAQQHYIPQGDNYQINYDELINSSTIDELVANASNQTFGNPTESKIGSEIIIYTPFAFSIQADYSITPRWYINTLLVRRLDFSPKTVERENILAVSIRYETKIFELGGHLSLYNDIYPRMGAWLRIGPLTVGSDNIGSVVIKQTQLRGTDVYFALRINPFRRKSNGRDRYELCNFKN